MPELTKQQKEEILQLLIECHADIKKLHARINELHLQDCTFSLQEISQVLQVSKERVRQLEYRALKKMRTAFKDTDIHDKKVS